MEFEGLRVKRENAWTDDLFIDMSAPGQQLRKADADTIGNATSNLLNNLVIHLKNLGVDCRTVKGNKEIEQQYYIELKSEQAQDRIYEPFFCEQVKNQYDALDDLEIHCHQFSSRAENVRITWANFKYVVDKETMSFNVPYNPGQATIGVSDKGWFKGGPGYLEETTQHIMEAAR